MLFTVGNLVTLAIVIAMFVAYHLLTADNRSLEKLKRLGDRLKDELSAFVDSKAEEVKHYGIELDVQQKAAKVVLEKIQEAQTTIDAESDSITKIAERFREYDETLARLMDMTKRVDQNIAHLAAQNEFIENLARRIEAAGKKMNAIENEMPSLREQFARDAKQILDGFRDDILAQLHERLDGIIVQFEQARGDAVQAIAKAAELRQQIDHIAELSLQKAMERAHTIEDEAFRTLRGKLAADSEALMRQTDAVLMKMRTEVSTQIQQLRAELEQLASETKKAGEDSRAALGEAEQQAQKRVEALDQKVKDALNALAVQSKAQIEEMASRLGEAKEAASTMSSEMERLRNQAAEIASSLEAQMHRVSQDLEEKFSSFGQALEAHRVSFEKDFLSELESLRAMLAETRGRTEELRAAAEGNIASALNGLEEQVQKELEARRENLDARLEAWLSEMDARMRKIQQDAIEHRKAEEARLAVEVNAELKKLKDSLYTQVQKLERDIDALKKV